MIKAIVGGVGSGKSVYAVKRIVDKGAPVYVNFDLRAPYAKRLKVSDVAEHDADTKKWGVNWAFWRDARVSGEDFDICIDEAHNILHSRQAMRGRSIAITNWVAQIRKVLGESERSDLIFVTQRLSRLDVAARDLLHSVTVCSKEVINIPTPTVFREGGRKRTKDVKRVFVKLSHFVGEGCVEKYYRFLDGMGKPDLYTWFYANPYFQYYDSFDLVPFGDEGEEFL